MATNTLELSSTINQRYKYDTAGKTPTQIQSELRKKGLRGFVVKVAGRKVTMKVMEQHVESNRGCIR
ncbi:hypothetical protein [Staphylococcus aureus]|uniref:hypothetical protein n=1 Tax=Staphylococcus aureus TaxID=1280 RepID=UPI00208F7A25|nr:hypothetical protein [Staphylococcus aureus]MCO4429339.1 hypothetical protein [Staphylococcus aureus]